MDSTDEEVVEEVRRRSPFFLSFLLSQACKLA